MRASQKGYSLCRTKLNCGDRTLFIRKQHGSLVQHIQKRTENIVDQTSLMIITEYRSLKAICFHRAGRLKHKQVWLEKRLFNPKAKLWTFNVLSDPNYSVFMKILYLAMKRPAKKGNVVAKRNTSNPSLVLCILAKHFRHQCWQLGISTGRSSSHLRWWF